MTYQQLNEQTIVPYLKSIAQFSPLITADTTATEVGDGNINYVYIVSGLKQNKKLVVKQAVPFLRCLGEQYRLAMDRMIYESNSLQHFHKLCPHHVPKIYHVDVDMSLFMMQYLGGPIIMHKGLIDKIKYLYFWECIQNDMSH